MNFKKIGIIFKKNTRPKVWWVKMGISLVISNVFFFLMFAPDSHEASKIKPNKSSGMVEVNVKAILHTPFQNRKRVILINRRSNKNLPAMLKAMNENSPEEVTVLIHESIAGELFRYHEWEIFPYLKKITLNQKKGKEIHEIHY